MIYAIGLVRGAMKQLCAILLYKVLKNQCTSNEVYLRDTLY